MKFLKALIDSIIAYSVFNKEVAELNNMSDLELRDIGLSRGDIFRIAAKRCL
jgi:uncharacterized protein YjiS (DUF1127 family)